MQLFPNMMHFLPDLMQISQSGCNFCVTKRKIAKRMRPSELGFCVWNGAFKTNFGEKVDKSTIMCYNGQSEKLTSKHYSAHKKADVRVNL